MTFTDDDKQRDRNPVFSDSDLERLKEEIDEEPGVNHDVYLRRDRLEALLARLERSEAERDAWKTRCEAAEACIDVKADSYDLWRWRSAGK